MITEGTDWDKIYYFIQSSQVSDPRYHSNNFDSQPVTVILKQVEAIEDRSMMIANRHSISIARCGLLFAGSDKLSEKDFLPFPALLETKKKSVGKTRVSKETAEIFLSSVKSGEISSLVMSAFSAYMDEIIGLVE